MLRRGFGGAWSDDGGLGEAATHATEGLVGQVQVLRNLGEHQQAVTEWERGREGAEEGGLGTMKEAAVPSGSSGWLRLARRPGLQIGSAQ